MNTASAATLPLALTSHLFRLGHSQRRARPAHARGDGARFDPRHLGRAPSRFDEQQLDVWQKDASAPAEQRGPRRRGWRRCCRRALSRVRRAPSSKALRPNLVLPEDAQPWVEIIFGAPPALGPEAEALVRSAGAGYFAAAAAAAPPGTGPICPASPGRRARPPGARAPSFTCRCAWRSPGAPTDRSWRHC